MTATSAPTAATTSDARTAAYRRRHELLECFRAATRSAGRIYITRASFAGGGELQRRVYVLKPTTNPQAVGDESDRAVLYPSI